MGRVVNLNGDSETRGSPADVVFLIETWNDTPPPLAGPMTVKYQKPCYRCGELIESERFEQTPETPEQLGEAALDYLLAQMAHHLDTCTGPQ